MADLGTIVDKIVLQEQIIHTVDFAKTRDNTGYLENSDFEEFFKTRSFSDKQIILVCQHCIDMIIQKYGHEAYPLQRFEIDGFKFVVEYHDFSDDDDTEEEKACRFHSFYHSFRFAQGTNKL